MGRSASGGVTGERLSWPQGEARELLVERLQENELAQLCHLAERLRDIAREIDESGGPQAFEGPAVPQA